MVALARRQTDLARVRRAVAFLVLPAAFLILPACQSQPHPPRQGPFKSMATYSAYRPVYGQPTPPGRPFFLRGYAGREARPGVGATAPAVAPPPELPY